MGIFLALISYIIDTYQHMSTISEGAIPTQTPFVFDPAKFLLIVGAAIFASSLSELISYFLLYRK